MNEFLKLSGARPSDYGGTIKLPPSKSYVHRALFVSSLCATESKIVGCGDSLSEDILATMNALKLLGVDQERKGADILVHPSPLSSFGNKGRQVFLGGSGTSARFFISLAAIPIDGGYTKITGDPSLRKRPMGPLLDALRQLGVDCRSINRNGRLPVIVRASGIAGGECRVDSSISSQFVSSLLIACTQARSDTRIRLVGSDVVSLPYIEATLSVLRYFGFLARMKKDTNSIEFYVRARQTGRRGKLFRPPGDMSSASALIGAALVAKRARVRFDVGNLKVPQADEAFLKIVEMLGASVTRSRNSFVVVVAERRATDSRKNLDFDLKDSPDLVPVLAGTACGMRRSIKIRNVGHLRFKESDRLESLKTELEKIGMKVNIDESSISISTSPRGNGTKRPVTLDPHDDHRILMALAVAGLSGNYGELLISNPSCVAKSYPAFFSDLSSLIRGEKIVSIVRR